MNRRQFLKGLIATGIVTICPIPLPEPSYTITVDLAAGPDLSAIMWARQFGKTLAYELEILRLMEINPNARIARVSSKGTELVSSKEEVLSRIRYGYGEDVYKLALDKSHTTKR